MKYYIIDDTVNKNSPVFFNQLNEVVTHLEGSIKRKTGISRLDYMQNLAELGHSLDDDAGIAFIAAMSEIFNIGLVKQNKLVKSNIVEATRYSGYRTEMGD
jgi:hypothetical protein